MDVASTEESTQNLCRCPRLGGSVQQFSYLSVETGRSHSSLHPLLWYSSFFWLIGWTSLLLHVILDISFFLVLLYLTYRSAAHLRDLTYLVESGSDFVENEQGGEKRLSIVRLDAIGSIIYYIAYSQYVYVLISFLHFRHLFLFAAFVLIFQSIQHHNSASYSRLSFDVSLLSQ